MQGIHDFIPTAEKVDYLNALLKVGFDTLDFGSFVSPKAIPQMQDTAEVLDKLELSGSKTKLLAIIANQRGAEQAAAYEQVTYLGYPFSVSETFQQRNTNRSIAIAFDDVKAIQALCEKSGKKLVLYLSMGFGNPYGDPWSPAIVEEWLEKMAAEGIRIFSLADTVGAAKVADIQALFSHLIGKRPDLEIGAHFHSRPDNQVDKIEAAYLSGCRRFDSALLGIGGCPMAKDDLTGNISTEALTAYLATRDDVHLHLDREKFEEVREQAMRLFGQYH